MTRFTFSRLFLTIVIIQTIAGVTLLFAEDCFVARWVNGTDANPSYYMADFWVPLKRHNNIGTYTPDFCSGCIIEADEFPAAVDHAVNTWNGAGLAGVPAYFNIQLESNVSSGQILNQFDGNNVIGFSTNAAEANMLSSENLTLAFCRVYIPEVFYTCPENNPLGPRFISDGADILFNRNRPFDVISATEANNLDYQRYDFESVVVHELSHFAGLCHTANYHDATNAVIYNADNSRRTLGDAATSIYNLYNLASLPQVAPCSVFKTLLLLEVIRVGKTQVLVAAVVVVGIIADLLLIQIIFQQTQEKTSHFLMIKIYAGILTYSVVVLYKINNILTRYLPRIIHATKLFKLRLKLLF